MQLANMGMFPKLNPEIKQFTRPLDKSIAKKLYKFASQYCPETRAQKKSRLKLLDKSFTQSPQREGTFINNEALISRPDISLKTCGNERQGHEEGEGEGFEHGNEVVQDPSFSSTLSIPSSSDKHSSDKDKPYFLKFGINHIEDLIKTSKATLIMLAYDTDPVDLVLHIPALCRKHHIPVAIVDGKLRLGTLIHKRQTAAVAFTNIRDQDIDLFQELVSKIKEDYEKNRTTQTSTANPLNLFTTARLNQLYSSILPI
ncbi:60S ribosomal protein L8B [Lobosporangium transversale]|uniref:50S ribosomal protein L30e-like protein n=1 Tax=Lobosporangium transversale TaxID=64571 RepID=A0A1Y2GTS0_9FUNG|nr:50S ribosomal protein L30e-like protein [Lobosporangium transversale]KAF9914217.1 60S ribosomal protein L8B [Lobosporangium transversale]ORZ22917.1 50S ribosomal protein L30e-like protein [Lobosporangium transversale]|eukprot:XP_021883471.1 50S ribosomal protein L30e-like protein [Lobosporangium transversale]